MWVRTPQWQPENTLIEQSDSGVILEVPYSEPVGYGPDVEAIEPVALREFAARALQEAPIPAGRFTPTRVGIP